MPELVQELQDLQDQTEERAQDPLAQAMLAQSQALTSLVSQLAAASGEPLLDLAGSGSVGVRQRAKLQDELAQGKGTFFTQVLSNLARRMQPALQHASSPGDLLRQGYSLSRYWERFRGWSASRDNALVAHQVALAFDALQADRVGLAKDHIALLAVFLEQSLLDSNRTDVAYQLTFLEEPPVGMFVARQGIGAQSRAFAPLASQRWVAVVLSYLKELDTIQGRRQEFAKAAKSAPSNPGGNQDRWSQPCQGACVSFVIAGPLLDCSLVSC